MNDLDDDYDFTYLNYYNLSIVKFEIFFILLFI